MTDAWSPSSSGPRFLVHVPELHVLETLLVVARGGSMSSASQVLQLSQQAISARVATAEKVLGLAVFERSPRGVVLTTSGQSIIAWAQAVVDAGCALEDGVLGMRPQRAPVLRVAASNTISECLLPGWAGALRREHPEVAMQARAGNSETVLALVAAGEVDLGFVECPRVPRALRSRTVATDQLVVVVAPDHPWASRRHVTRDELSRAALVMREPGSGTRARFTQAYPQHAPPVAELTSTAAVREAVGTLGAPAVLSSLAVQQDIAGGRLVAVEVHDNAMPRLLRAVWNPHQRPRGLGADLLRIAAASQSRTAARPSRPTP